MDKYGKLSLFGLISGVISLILCYYKIGGILGIAAITLGIIALTKGCDKKALAIVGLVCGIIGLICSSLVAFTELADSIKESKGKTEAIESRAEPTHEPTPDPTPKPTREPTATPTPTPEPQIEEDEDDGSIWASDFTPISDFRYKVDESKKEITLVRYRGSDSKIMLSPVYNLGGEDYKLVSMGDDACFLSETYITSVYIPDGVTYIGDTCFNSCSNLQHVRIPKTVESINWNFFTYFDDFTMVYEADIEHPEGHDTSQYDLSPDDATQAAELGENMARALNGMLGGFNESMDDSKRSETIYFAGTESEWVSIGGELSKDRPQSSVDESDGNYQKGKEAGDKLAEDLSNIDW